MNITCERLDDLLLEGDPLAMETAARHAAGCAACAETLATWQDLSGTAATLHESWESDVLWPRIERSIRAEALSARTDASRRRSVARLWQVAAALFLAAILGAGAWFGLRTREARQFDARILRVDVLDDVDRAEKQHLAAIDRLEGMTRLEGTTDARTGEPSTPLMISYKEKLLVLDDAIAQCQTAIDHNRQNAHLRRQLLAMYSEKQRTLQDVLREENQNHVANQ
jgi:hypothetical protein